ncbi:MAG: sulfatase-like hydrolase/transferase [Solirubrobacterales bacterium]|nr:sulfatase-like hydrolase/transferase [Solirubrobacterales bacterium]
MSPDPETANDTKISWFRIWAELAGAWALALAHPIYTNIASGPEALTSYGVRRLDLLVLIFVVSLLGPLVITLAELSIRRLFGDRPRRVVHGAVIGSLLALVLWQWLVGHGSPGVLRALLPFALAILVTWLFLRAELVRNFVLILSFATVAVILLFCLDYPIRDEMLPHEKAAKTGKIESDTPVVMVIFDEFPLDAIERPDGTVDPRFRNLSMLARKATWYPGALSMGDQTTRAVPSILTGQDPYKEEGWKPPSPGLASYPNSVCRIAEDGGYEVHSYEPVTDLCEQNWDMGTRVTATIRRAVALASATEPLAPLGLDEKAAGLLNLPFRMPWSEYSGDRPAAVDSFIEGLPDSDRAISVLHIALPHISWMFSPDGSTYDGLRPAGDDMLVSPSTEGQLDRDAQQMMLQIGYTDRELGRLIRKMKSSGIWDKSLFVVTADHGGAFELKSSRRLVNLFNAGWIAPVPLFIKYPGQERGQVVRGTVDGRDIVPTVLGQLGVDPPDQVTGRDLTGRSKMPVAKEHGMSAPFGGWVEFKLRDVKSVQKLATDYIHRLFGRSLYAPGGRADLLGKSPAGMTEIPSEATDPSLYSDVDLDSGQIPAYFEARLDPPGGTPTDTVAVSLNGRIAATATPWQVDGQWMVGVNLPTRGFRDGANAIKVYEIDPGR